MLTSRTHRIDGYPIRVETPQANPRHPRSACWMLPSGSDQLHADTLRGNLWGFHCFKQAKNFWHVGFSSLPYGRFKFQVWVANFQTLSQLPMRQDTNSPLDCPFPPISQLPVRQDTQSSWNIIAADFSQLPMRQDTFKGYGGDVTQISQLPMRQDTVIKRLYLQLNQSISSFAPINPFSLDAP